MKVTELRAQLKERTGSVFSGLKKQELQNKLLELIAGDDDVVVSDVDIDADDVLQQVDAELTDIKDDVEVDVDVEEPIVESPESKPEEQTTGESEADKGLSEIDRRAARAARFGVELPNKDKAKLRKQRFNSGSNNDSNSEDQPKAKKAKTGASSEWQAQLAKRSARFGVPVPTPTTTNNNKKTAKKAAKTNYKPKKSVNAELLTKISSRKERFSTQSENDKAAQRKSRFQKSGKSEEGSKGGITASATADPELAAKVAARQARFA